MDVAIILNFKMELVLFCLIVHRQEHNDFALLSCMDIVVFPKDFPPYALCLSAIYEYVVQIYLATTSQEIHQFGLRQVFGNLL